MTAYAIVLGIPLYVAFALALTKLVSFLLRRANPEQTRKAPIALSNGGTPMHVTKNRPRRTVRFG